MKEIEEKRSHKRIGTPSNPLRVKIKKIGDSSVIPTYAHDTDAGMDLYCTATEYDNYGNFVCHTGIALEIPRGYVGLVVPRSSISNTCQQLCNSIGIIDAGYRGEITMKFLCRYKLVCMSSIFDRIKYFIKGKGFNSKRGISSSNNWDHTQYQVGDRIGQLIIMPYPKVLMVEVDELSETDRGTGGYGSTGK